MKFHNEPIPDGKLTDFHEILCACGGRYLRNPIEAPDQWGRYRVDYAYADTEKANEHQRRWRRVTEDVSEVHRNQWWRVLLRKAQFWKR